MAQLVNLDLNVEVTPVRKVTIDLDAHEAGCLYRLLAETRHGSPTQALFDILVRIDDEHGLPHDGTWDTHGIPTWDNG